MRSTITRKSLGRIAATALAAAALVTATAGIAQAAAPAEAPAAPASGTAAVQEVGGTLYYVAGSSVRAWTPGQAPTVLFTATGNIAGSASVSPDGRYLSYFVRGDAYPKQNLVVRDLTTGTEKVVYKGIVQGGEICADTQWAPDGSARVMTLTGYVEGKGYAARWFDAKTGKVTSTVHVRNCNEPRAALRADGGFDIYQIEEGELVRTAPNGSRTILSAVNAGLQATLGEALDNLSSVSRDGTRACVTVGWSNFIRPLECDVVVDTGTGEVLHQRTGDEPGTVKLLDDGTMLVDDGATVTHLSADGAVLAQSAEPATLSSANLLSHRG
ncbi:hypothetical protein AB0I28_23530 [Phytomonospora sp. NPDC050363]|uniref:hypothetical protein n=1 Tax=Phytomonospora sp. NPDC050363 TaxID=3155642 RepID=UPI0034037DB5